MGIPAEVLNDLYFQLRLRDLMGSFCRKFED